MPLSATMWIRDGVLVDRMHVNPVAFAASYLAFAQTSATLTDLINFGFAQSGVSCAQKMQLFNQSGAGSLSDVDAAAGFYNTIASQAASNCDYFPGALELLGQLKSDGVENFITSAVEQEVLAAWAATPQGAAAAAHLQEILGKRGALVKGQPHFAYVSQRVGGGRIYYIADAVAEIATAHKFTAQYNLVLIGFAHEITADRVVQAAGIIEQLMQHAPQPVAMRVDRHKLELPTEQQLTESLTAAGASLVVTGGYLEIMANLKDALAGMSNAPPAPRGKI